MSRMSNLKHEVMLLSNKIGGSKASISNRQRSFAQFTLHLQTTGQLPHCVSSIVSKSLLSFALILKAKYTHPGTIQNIIGGVRKILRAARVDIRAQASNASIGLTPRSRAPGKKPFPDSDLEILYSRAMTKDEGLLHCLKLERLTGLRGQEAMMSAGSLVHWCKSILRDGSVEVEHGTKGGRSRVSALIESRTLETIQAIQDAHVYAEKHNNFLIHGFKENLKSARSKYHRLCREIGLVKPYSPHSLRYSFAVEKLVELLDQGFGSKEACTIVSQLLGHGDGRGRWVRSVYCRTVDLPEKVKTTDLVNKLLTEAIEILKKRGKEF